jgi:4-hydroxybenzoate polyprenyltransferase
LDIITLSSNYVWRILAGIVLLANVPHPPISGWIIFGFFFVALLLALGKRRGELMLLGKEVASEHREVFKSYNKEVLDYGISATSTLIILFYTLYTLNAPIGDLRLTVTIPIILFIVFRYAYLIYTNSYIARSPEKLIHDRALITALVIWIILVGTLLYIYPV